jgi:4-hydroxy-tetrahydrodipicolinate synthase
VPIVVQNASPPLGTPISVALIARLVQECEWVAYVKEEVQPSTHRVTEILASAGQGLAGAFGGRAGLHMLDELRRGSAGVFPGASWVDFHVAVFDAFERGDHVAARRAFNRLLPAINMGMMLGLALTKTVLVRRGVLRTATCRDGSPPLDAFDLAELDAIWAELGPTRWTT